MGVVYECWIGNHVVELHPMLALAPGALIMSIGEVCEACLHDNSTIIAADLCVNV